MEEAYNSYYFFLTEKLNRKIDEKVFYYKTKELSSFISKIMSKSQEPDCNSIDITSKKLSVSRIIYEKLKSAQEYHNQPLELYIGICLDCIIETPPEFFEVTKFAQLSLSIISELGKPELFDDILRQKVSAIFESIIQNPALLISSSHHKKLIQIFSPYSRQFIMTYKSQLISLLINSFHETFDYQLLCDLIECFINLNLAVKHSRNKEQTLLFKINQEGACEWEILWSVHVAEFLNQIKCNTFGIGWVQIHQINVNLMILTSLLRSRQNLCFVEIPLNTFNDIFVQALEFISTTRHPEISPIFNQHFLNIFLLFIDVFIKVIKSNFHVLFEPIIIVIHYIFEYAFHINNLLLITNCLVVMENVYGMIIVMNRSNAEGFWIRSKTIVLECIEQLESVKTTFLNNNFNLSLVQAQCSEIMSFLQEREKFVSKLFNTLIFQVNAKAILLESVILTTMTLAKNLIEFINFCERYYNLKQNDHVCLRNIGESISKFLSNIFKRNSFNKYCNNIPMNQFVANLKEIYDGLEFKHGFNEITGIEDKKENVVQLNYDYNDKVMEKESEEVVMQPHIITNVPNTISESKSPINELIHHDIFQNVTSHVSLESDEECINPLSQELLKYFVLK